MKLIIKIFNILKKFKTLIGLAVLFLPMIIKNYFKNRKNIKYHKEIYKVNKLRDGETIENKRKKYNKKR